MTAVEAIGAWAGVRRYLAGPMTRTVLAGDRHRDGRGVYLHRFAGDGPGSALHDHPWPFLSLVLWGGYWEYSTAGGRTDPGATVVRRWHGPGRLLYRRPHRLHRVEVPAGRVAWTLFVHGRRSRAAGTRFWCPGVGFIPWRPGVGGPGGCDQPTTEGP